MLSKDERKYLISGLNALSRAYEFNYFVDGHRGGAILSAVFLCRENNIEAGVSDRIEAILENYWINTSLCAPFPDEQADPSLLRQVEISMQNSSSDLREAGHNIILPTLALKAFSKVPEAITPARVSGICQLIESFKITNVPPSEAISLPDIEDQAAFANFVLDEFIQCTKRFHNFGQGWSGHLLTYSKALLDLIESGHVDTAYRALAGYKLYIRRIRSGPQEIDKPRPEHAPLQFFPLEKAYWMQREGDLHLGHQIKYPYGFYGLLHAANNESLQRESLQEAYRIF